MIAIELTHFDQTTALLTAFCALALIRERRVLPFLASFVGALFQGPPIPSLVAALVVWHRMDLGCKKLLQIKDFGGLLLVLVGSVATDPANSFFSWLGVFLISVNFGGGGLGTLPALLFLRQYHPQPEFLEIALVGHAAYWILVEVARWTELPREKTVLSWAELVGGLLILSSFRRDVEITFENPFFAVWAGMLVTAVVSVFLWIQFRSASFQVFYQRLRAHSSHLLFWGGRFISGEEPWSEKIRHREDSEFETAVNGVFWWVLGVSLISAFVGILSMGVRT